MAHREALTMGKVLQEGKFYGETKKKCKLPGMVLPETIHPPRFRTSWHSHEDAYLCLVLNGSYTEVCGVKTHACNTFTLAFHPPGEMHYQSFHDAEVRSFNVELGSSSIARIREYSDVLDRAPHLQGGIFAMLAMRLYSEFRHLDGVSPLAIEGLLLELIAAVSRRTAGNFRSKSDTWLRQADDLLRARFSESLSLSEIAQQLGVHPVHLARGFRRCFGFTVGEYVRQLRVDFARRALSEGNAPLRDVALDAGFFDQSHFCRVFRRFIGMTPQEYRSLMSPLSAQHPESGEAHKAGNRTLN